MQGKQGAAAALERPPPYAAGPWIQAQNSPSVDTLCNSCCIRHAWPGGSRGSVHPGSGCSAGGCASQAPIPLLAEGTIKLVLMSSGTVLIARLRHTSDRDGQPAFQLLRPRVVQEQEGSWTLQPFLDQLTPQQDLVVFKSAVASLLEPAPALLSQYGEESKQEVPQAASPLERLKQAFQDFTDSVDGAQPPGA